MRRAISWFIGIVLVLATLGVLILASASSAKYEDSTYFWRRQLMWLALSFLTACVAARFDYRFYRRLAIPLAVVSLTLLVIVRLFFPAINGSHRWILLFGFTFQPSELAKVAMILLMAWWLERYQRRIGEFRYGTLVPFGLLGCFAAAIVIAPDFGTTMLVSAVAIAMMFLGGSRILPMAALGLTGLFGVSVLIAMQDERMARIMAFLDPQKHEQDKAWQLTNSLRAFANGEWRGVGFGNSIQKLHYLPEAHTDFIFPIIGEELGLVMALPVVLCYLALFGLGLRIAVKADDEFGRLVAFGITLMISVQALINFAVVTGCVPTKGLALPFISYGGSSLLVSGLMVGILINIAHSAGHAPSAAARNLFKDRARKV